MSDARRAGGTGLPPDERELLLAAVISRHRAWVVAHPDLHLTPQQRRQYHRLLRRRQNGTPIAYLTGVKDFYGRPFTVGRGVLVPRPETEHLIEAALNIVPRRTPWLIADLGTGSGCCAITIALERPNCTVIASDASRLALKYAAGNARRFRVQHRIRFVRGNFLDPIKRAGGLPRLILANPPYLTPAEASHLHAEPRRALDGGGDGLAAYRTILKQIRNFGYPHVPLVLEIDPRRRQAVLDLLTATYRRSAITVLPDLAGRARIIVVEPAEANETRKLRTLGPRRSRRRVQ